MSKIEKLTDEQIARFPEYIDKWTKIGLGTEPADRPRAEAGIVKAYERAGLPAPRIVWCGSPLSQGITRAIVKQLADSTAGASVRASVGDSVWASVRDSVGDSVMASVRDSVWASVRDSVWDSVRDSVWDSGYGQHDANWIGFYDYFRRICGLTHQTEKLEGLTEICESAGWFLPHGKLCWVSERHCKLHKNERGQLHCEDGPALEYPDGWQLWRLRGVAVDEQIVVRPETQTVGQIRSEQNAEVKRLRIERYGWPKFLSAVNAKRISTRRNDIEGTRESLYQTDGAAVLVCACPSTAKLFALEVPPDIATCEQAQRYLSSGLSGRIISAA